MGSWPIVFNYFHCSINFDIWQVSQMKREKKGGMTERGKGLKVVGGREEQRRRGKWRGITKRDTRDLNIKEGRKWQREPAGRREQEFGD